METKETVRVRVARFRESLREVVRGRLGMRAAQYLAGVLDDDDAKTRDKILAAQALLRAGMALEAREPAAQGMDMAEFFDAIKAWKDGYRRGDPDLPQPPPQASWLLREAKADANKTPEEGGESPVPVNGPPSENNAAVPPATP